LLIFDGLSQNLPKPRRLADAAFDEMMRILMAQDERKFDRAALIKLLQDRMNLPSTRFLREAFSILGKDERVRVERDESGKKRYSWAVPGTGALGEEGVRLAAGDGAGRDQLVFAQQSPPQPGGAGDREDAKQVQLSGTVGPTDQSAAKG